MIDLDKPEFGLWVAHGGNEHLLMRIAELWMWLPARGSQGRLFKPSMCRQVAEACGEEKWLLLSRLLSSHLQCRGER